MAPVASAHTTKKMQKIILPFLSGFLAALFFHEAALALLHAANVIDAAGFSTQPFAPLGIPEFIANALMSACWAIPMTWLLRVTPHRPAPWIGALVFGGIVLTAARVFAIDPLRGIWPSGNMLTPLTINFAANAVWGWGTLVFVRAFMSDDDGND
jgi:hypothetical protein